MAGDQVLMDPHALSKLGIQAQDRIWDNMAGNASGLEHVTALNGLTPLNQNSWKEVLRDTLQVHITRSLQIARDTGTSPIADRVSVNIMKMLGADVVLLEGNNWQVYGYEFWREDLGLPFHDGLVAYRAVGGWSPDAYFAKTIAPAQTLEYADFIRYIGSANFDIKEQPIVLVPEGETPVENAVATIDGRLRGYNWISFDVTVTSPDRAFLVTGENYFPGWRAYIDGEPVNYFKANYLLSGVFVPQGSHGVMLRYEPDSVREGTIITFSGFVLLIIFLVFGIVMHRKGRMKPIPPIESEPSIIEK